MRPSQEVLFVVALGLCACQDRVSNAAADNTSRNERDRSAQATTPTDQKSNETDLKITQDIRKAIVERKDLSTNAHNVKVITENCVVTLRGPVDSASERTAIDSIASATARVARVDNQLEVKAEDK